MKEDRRIVRTRRMIDEAMMTLLEEKPFNEINVTELCEKADINRNTFYAHYEKPLDVLKHLENKMMDQIADALLNTDLSESVIEKVLMVLESNKRLTKILLSDHMGSDFSEKLFQFGKSRTLSVAKQRASRLSPAYESMLSHFSIAGGAAVVRCWADNGFQESSKDVANFIRHVTFYGSYGIQDDPAPEFQ
jgi:AcrR family transcriptional regulator